MTTTSSDFVAGSFDLTRFQVLTDGTYAYLRATLRTLVPTFGVLDGAQLLDVYVHVPGASPVSTGAAFASRNCAAGGGEPVCSADPATAPKAVDVITPAGVSQATELDPTAGPVVIAPVVVP